METGGRVVEITVGEGGCERVSAQILIELTATIQRHFNIFLQNKISLSALSMTSQRLSYRYLAQKVTVPKCTGPREARWWMGNASFIALP